MYIDSMALTKFLEFVVKRQSGFIFLDFPRIVKDINYLYKKLEFIHEGTNSYEWSDAFDRIAKPEKIHI